MRNLLWQSEAWKEYESLQAEKATLKKVNKLLKDIMRNGYECSYGKVEMLKGISADLPVSGLIRKTESFSARMTTK